MFLIKISISFFFYLIKIFISFKLIDKKNLKMYS